MRYCFRRGADINKQRRAIGDLRRDLTGDTFFFFRLRRLTIVPRRVHRTGRQRRAAVMAQNHILFRQIVQIPTDGLRADREMLHQFFGADVSLFFYQFNDRVMSLCLFHESSLKVTHPVPEIGIALSGLEKYPDRLMFVFAHSAYRQRPSLNQRPARRCARRSPLTYQTSQTSQRLSTITQK